MNDQHILSKEELNSSENMERLHSIEESNPNLHHYMMAVISEQSFPGIREDVFRYICDNADKFSDEHEYAYNISQFISNTKIDVSWYEWLNGKYDDIVKNIPIIDFSLLLTEAVEKDMPLSAFSEIYEKNQADLALLVEDLEKYENEKDISAADKQNDNNSDSEKQKEKSTSEIVPAKENLPGSNVESPSYNREPEYAEMFNNLLTIMTDKHEDDKFDLQDKVQKNISELSSMFNDIFRLWDSDKNEMHRLEALYKLQQKILYTQQQKINEMRNTITRLQYQLNEADKKDMKRVEIQKKITEMQSLMSSDTEQIGIGEL